MVKPENLAERVLHFIIDEKLLSSGTKVLVGVSGGPDSVALLYLLRELAPELRVTLHIAHLNHLLREQAGDDAAFVQRMAHRLDLPVTIGYARVAAIASQRGLGIEEAGRLARYSFLYQAARRCGAGRIAVAHQADDQAETILFNLLRGSGATGLAGMSPLSGTLIRPLLCVTKEELETYCRRRRLPWRVDTTNLDTNYYRNRIRHRLLPLLREEFNPRIDQALVRLGRILRDEEVFFNALTERILNRLLLTRESDRVVLDLRGMLRLPVALRRRLLRKLVTAAGAELRDIGYRQIDEALSWLETGTPGGRLQFPHQVRIYLGKGSFAVSSRELVRQEVPPVETRLAIPGRTPVAELGVEVLAEIKKADRNGEQGLIRPRHNWQAIFDYQKVALPLYLRNRRPGDRISLLGMEGGKKLKKLLGELKIPPEKRSGLPLLASRQEIYWLPGYRRSSLASVTAATEQILVITVRKKLNHYYKT